VARAIPYDCSVILATVSGHQRGEEALSEIRAAVTARIRNAPIVGNRAHLVLPIVRHSEVLGLSVSPDAKSVLVAVYAHYTERFFGKHERKRVFLLQLHLAHAFRQPFTEVVDIDVLEPDSLVSDNGAISSATYKSLVAKLTRFQANALEAAEDLGISEPHVRSMNLYQEPGPKATQAFLRVEIESLNHPEEKSVAFLATVDMERHLIGEMVPERTQGLPKQPEPLIPSTNADHLVYDSAQSLLQNITRAVRTKIDDDQTHVGDQAPIVEFEGYFKGHHGETIYAAKTNVTIYNENQLTIGYLVVVTPDQKMKVLRQESVDAEGDPVRVNVESDWRRSLLEIKFHSDDLFEKNPKEFVQVEEPQFIASLRSEPVQIKKVEGGSDYVSDPNRYFAVFRVKVKVLNLQTREPSERTYLVATESCGDTLYNKILLAD
jgi:hypothetical protein